MNKIIELSHKCFDAQVNSIAFHPEYGTLSTAGSDGKFSFWDKDARTKLKTSEQMEQPITCCAFDAKGQIFAYAVSYDWSKVYLSFISRVCVVTGMKTGREFVTYQVL